MITSAIDVGATRAAIRALTLKVLAGYVALVTAVNLVRLAMGDGSVVLVGAQLLVLGATWHSLHANRRFWIVVGDWLPLVVLPVLYWGLPWVQIGPGGRLHDSIVQAWDQMLFGTQPARALALALPSRPLSELLHLAYLAYYAIIYAPPLVLYLADSRRGYYETVLALTVTVVVSFTAFSVFPVEGPRFAWGPLASVPSGPIRHLTLLILERGSARGTAFPSSHVAIAVAQALSSLRWRRSLGVAVLIAAGLLAVGAVYGGLHYAADVLAGLAVGCGAWALARGMESSLGSRVRGDGQAVSS